MINVEGWPPPLDWDEVVITWESLIQTDNYHPMMKWVHETPGGRYHLHGYKSTEGFAFRFENPSDATLFRLRWS
jgi:hypothetical protein